MMKLSALFLLLILSSCSVTKDSGVTIHIRAKCILNSGDQAIFESKYGGYNEIIVKDHVNQYEVGRYYMLEFKKK